MHTLSAATPFQNRPELAEVQTWWGGGGGGIFALVGIGGSGKTVLVERFLDLLRADVSAGPAGTSSVLVFSFREPMADADKFWNETADWLGMSFGKGVGRDDRWRLLERSTVKRPVLLILDGFEAAQEAWGGDRFGQPHDAALRALLERCADGILAGVSILLASRFAPAHLKSRRCYRNVATDRLTAAAAIDLLRQSGAAGSREHLARMAAELAEHALTLKRTAGRLAKLLPAERPAAPDSQEVENRVAEDLVQTYRGLLEDHDPAALELWRQMSLFPLSARRRSGGVRLEAVTHISGDGPQLRQLERLRLLVMGGPFPSLHPAVGVPYRHDDQEESRRVAHTYHCRDLERVLGEHFDEPHPQDARVLDLLEELVYQTYAAGDPAGAWSLYWFNIGGYRNLGWRLGDYERGERICRVLAGGSLATHTEGRRLGLSGEANLLNEWGLYLMGLGSLVYAEACFRRALASPISSDQEPVVRQNLAEILLQHGRLPEAAQTCEEAIAFARRTDASDPPALAQLLAYVRTLLGEAVETRAGADPGAEDPRSLPGFAGHYRALQLVRRKEREAAGDLVHANETLCGARWGAANCWSPACRLIRAELATDAGDTEAALALADRAEGWAATRGACELLCRVQWVRARAILAGAGSCAASMPATREALARAAEAVHAGIAMAQDCGFAVHHADLQILSARISLAAADPVAALASARLSLYGTQRADGGVLPGAAHPDCRYIWAEGEARHLLAEAQATLGGTVTDRPLPEDRPEPAAAADRNLVFFCYAREDGTRNRKQLEVMLAPMKKDGLKTFTDTEIQPGAEWQQEISQALAATRVAVLFVGPHFLNSDFIDKVELPLILDAAGSGRLTIIWLCVSACNWERTRLSDFQAAHDTKVPLDSMQLAARKKLLKTISQQIEAAFSEKR